MSAIVKPSKNSDMKSGEVASTRSKGAENELYPESSTSKGVFLTGNIINI